MPPDDVLQPRIPKFTKAPPKSGAFAVCGCEIEPHRSQATGGNPKGKPKG
jgi:hypothetical protein